MQDGIIKGTGNSRKLKSAITEATTWEQFRAALIAGTLPIDLAGINTDGWQQLATALSKGNLLSDTTAALINTLVGSTPSTPDAALSAITGKTQTLYNGRVQIATGSYTGTGTYGSSNPNTLICPFAAKLLVMPGLYTSASAFIPCGGYNTQGFIPLVAISPLTTNYVGGVGPGLQWSTSKPYAKKSEDGKTIYWYNSAADAQMNYSGYIYPYVFIG